MNDLFLTICLMLATTLTGLLCGASLDQSIKQLPARHTIGVASFAAYARAADLKSGVLWYAILGVGGAISSILTATWVLINHSAQSCAFPLYLAAIFAVCHTFCTTQAAPTYFKLKKTETETELTQLFNKFERIQTFRSVFVSLNFISLLWAFMVLL